MSTDSAASTAAPKRNTIGLYSTVGVVAIGLIAAGVSYLTRNVPVQIDFTDNKFYSLTDGTSQILKGIDTPVKATLFVSEGKDLPPELIGRVKDLEALLRQYEQKSPDGKFRIVKVNPAPDTEGGEQAALAGVQSQPTRSGDVFLTLSVSCLDKLENVDFLALMGREEQFEYEISRAIANVLKGDAKKKIGVMSALPLMGSMGPMMGGAQRPWIFFQQLKRDYDVTTVEMTTDKIDSALDALMVVHPAGISEAGQYAIDQFVLSGKPVVLMLDSHSLVGKMTAGRQNPQMAMMGGEQVSSSVPKLTAAWGYGYDATQVVADMLFKTPLQGNRESPVFLTLGEQAFNRKDPTTSGLTDLLFVFSGAFTGKPAEGLTEDILLRSSGENEMVSPLTAENSDDTIIQKFKSTGEPKALALRLTGKFKTAFPDGKPKPAPDKEEDDEKRDEEKKEEEKKDESGTALKEMAEGKTGVVVLIGDSDFLFDNFSVRVFGNMAMPFNGNLPFGMNVVDQVAGDTRLLQVRSRNSNRRPFTRINAIETAANAEIQSQVEVLQKQADEANAKLGELQAAKDPKQQNFISPEQQAEIESFRKKQAEAQRKIRELRKGARADIDGTLAWIKFLNILGTPALVAAVGLAVFLVRRKSTSAK
ncbi:MAG: Gldg family protein [Verrucomicrobiales bacterium]